MKAQQEHERAHQKTSSPDQQEKMGGPTHFFRVSFFAVLLVFLIARPASAQLQFLQAPGGLSGTQVGNSYSVSFGTMNALGIGTPATGLTVTTLNNGALYFTEYQITFSGITAGHKASLTVYVSGNFAHPAAMVMENCPYTATCNSAASYSATSTSAAAPSGVIPSPGQANTTVTAGIGIFIPDNNGASSYTGNDTVEISYVMKDLTTNATLATANIFFNTPSETLQDAVQLTLSTAPGGVTITPAADYSMSFGNVNGIGIGPGAGLTTSSVAGGIVYGTPYLLNAAYSDFNTTNAALTVYVSTNFAHPTILQLRDSGAIGGPFTSISTSAAAPTSISTTAQDRVAVTRYLGLFVSNINGATAFTGTDNARLTFTLTVP